MSLGTKLAVAFALIGVSMGFFTNVSHAQSSSDSGAPTSYRSYAIHPHEGREPSMQYRDEMRLRATHWLTERHEKNWSPQFMNLIGELYEDPSAPLSHYVRGFGADLQVTLGLSGKLERGMSPSYVHSLIQSVTFDSLPIQKLGTSDWRFDAVVVGVSPVEAIRVVSFEGDRLTLELDKTFYALHGRDRRVTPSFPDNALPDFAYFQTDQTFNATITLSFALEGLQPAPVLGPINKGRAIGHEAWKRAVATTVFELMAPYAQSHMKSAEGNPSISLQADKVSPVGGFAKDTHMVIATMTVSGLLDDSVEAERWTGLARLQDGTWYLERLWFAHKCRRGPNSFVWTNGACV